MKALTSRRTGSPVPLLEKNVRPSRHRSDLIPIPDRHPPPRIAGARLHVRWQDLVGRDSQFDNGRSTRDADPSGMDTHPLDPMRKRSGASDVSSGASRRIFFLRIGRRIAPWTENRPLLRPSAAFFSSGPCAKRPGWAPDGLGGALLGPVAPLAARQSEIREALGRTRTLLGIPPDYRILLVPASDTGAIELAMWSLLGPRPVDVFVWESFGAEWMTDAIDQLKLKDTRVFSARYGALPDLNAAEPGHDIVFVWNGTDVGGARPPRVIGSLPTARVLRFATRRARLSQWNCRGKSSMPRLSPGRNRWAGRRPAWLVLSPRAMARLDSHAPGWPLAKVFRLKKDGKLIDGLFEDETINTPSMPCSGGLSGCAGLGRNRSVAWKTLFARNRRHSPAFAVGAKERNGRVHGRRRAIPIQTHRFVSRSSTRGSRAMERSAQASTGCEPHASPWNRSRSLSTSARTAPRHPALRIWCGPTVDAKDIASLTAWLDWGLGAHTAPMNPARTKQDAMTPQLALNFLWAFWS